MKHQCKNRISWMVVCAALAAYVQPGAFAAIDNPAEIAGCVLWLDAADVASITLSNNKVTQWSDKSVSGKHVAQTTDAIRPTSGGVSLNGLNTLSFDGNSYLLGGAVLPANDTTFSFYAVWRRADPGSGARAVVEQGATTAAIGSRASLLTVGAKYGFSGQGNDRHDLAPIGANEWKISGLVVDGRETRNVLLWDNDKYYAGDINMSQRATGDDGLCVGAKFQNKGEKLLGEIAEIVIFDRVLSDTERNAMLYYLQEKWGIDCNVRDVSMLIDFEHNAFPPGWVAEGALTNQPVCSSRTAFNKHGDWMLGSYENDKKNGNSTLGNGAIGSVTGSPFVLSNNTIRARVGGGNLSGVGAECQLQLEHEAAPGIWKVVRKATGPNSNTMAEIKWNVLNLIGETVRFKIVDNYASVWGQIIVDDIRVLQEPIPRAIYTEFSDEHLPDTLFAHSGLASASIGLTSTNTLQITLNDEGYNIWDYVDRGPKVLLSTIDDDAFVLETRLLARNFTTTNENLNTMAGLILLFEDVDANNIDPVMFGVYRDQGVRVEGPSITEPFNQLSGLIKSIWLRIEGRKDKFSFLCSSDGSSWQTVRTDNLKGKVVMQAGLFAKNWGSVTAPFMVEFDYLDYRAEKIPDGTIIVLQ